MDDLEKAKEELRQIRQEMREPRDCYFIVDENEEIIGCKGWKKRVHYWNKNRIK